MLTLLALLACDRGDPQDVLKPDPDARERVWHWSRPEGGAWTIDPEPFAWGFSSLHAAVIGDELILTGINRTHQIQPWEERWRHFMIDAIVSRDARTWSGRRYWGKGEIGGVDPAFVQDDAGWGAWLAHTAGSDGDPADPHRTVELMRAPMDGRSLGAPVTWATTRGAVDPAPAVFQGKLHVFATTESRWVVEVQPDGSLVRLWENASVPFARVKGDELQLVAQQIVPGRMEKRWIMRGPTMVEVEDRTDDRRLPFLRTSKDGVTWSESTLIAADDRIRSCASPVLVDFAGLEHLFCVEERMVELAMPPEGAPPPANGAPAPQNGTSSGPNGPPLPPPR